MKKLNYLLLPLLSMPFLASCGCANAKCDKVSEEVFNNAIKNVGITHVQVKFLAQMDFGEGLEDCMKINAKVSPTKVYGETDDEDGLEKVYAWSINDTQYKCTTNEGSGWSIDSEAMEKADEDGIWATPQTLSCNILFYGTTFNYSDFKYRESGYYAEIENKDPESNEGYDLSKVTIFFKNKKITKVTNLLYLKDANQQYELAAKYTANYSYSKIEPKDPRK